jgi:acetoin utilization deacetylase AcuC-like enzyme
MSSCRIQSKRTMTRWTASSISLWVSTLMQVGDFFFFLFFFFCFVSVDSANSSRLAMAIIHEHRMQAHAPASEKYVYELPQRIVAIESVLRGMGFADETAKKPVVVCPPSQMHEAPWSLLSSPIRSGKSADEVVEAARLSVEQLPLEELLSVEKDDGSRWELFQSSAARPNSLWARCKIVRAPAADVSWLRLVHDESFLRDLARKCAVAKLGHVTFSEQNGDLYFSPGTLTSALLAAGGAVESVRQLFDVNGGRSDVAASFAIVRPPGHHCHSKGAGGFCLLSNSAIAAQYARRMVGLARVAVVDTDYHHGDGTQEIFYDDPSVLTISIHVGVTYGSKEVADPSTTYPYGPAKGSSFLGGPNALGYNVNICWPHEFVDEHDYDEAMRTIVVPMLGKFDPQLIVWACGFDAVKGDKLAGTLLSTDAYWRLGRHLVSACGAPVAAVLEGGYKPELLGLAAENVVRALSGLAGPTGRRRAADAPVVPATALSRALPELRRLEPRPRPPCPCDHLPIRPEATLEHVRRVLNQVAPWKGLFEEHPEMTMVEEDNAKFEGML